MGDNNSDIAAAFRGKALYMKNWKPASTPSNRDRLELFALHKQAISGDAPSTLPSSATAPEKAKYQAWRSKNGLSQEDAMKLYIQESDRQLRVYGTTPSDAAGASLPSTDSANGAVTNTNDNDANNNSNNNTTAAPPRGLAAIPLLCAAASESRSAYLRRLAQTSMDSAWWKRQEPLCGTPGTWTAIPEYILIQIGRLVEFISLAIPDNAFPPKSVFQSFFWPLHNVALSVWMCLIVVYLCMESSWSAVQTLLWGARRTGIPLTTIWNDYIQVTSDSVGTMCEPYQALSSRSVGLILSPYMIIVGFLNACGFGPSNNITLACLLYTFMVVGTWWYWWVVAPWLCVALVFIAFSSGSCFALIEFAGV